MRPASGIERPISSPIPCHVWARGIDSSLIVDAMRVYVQESSGESQAR